MYTRMSILGTIRFFISAKEQEAVLLHICEIKVSLKNRQKSPNWSN